MPKHTKFSVKFPSAFYIVYQMVNAEVLMILSYNLGAFFCQTE